MKASQVKKQFAAHDVIAGLRRAFPSPAFAMLTEVRNQTGYGQRERYADAVVTSCWPSRGIWIAGVEVKVSRSDWRKELATPTKADAIQKYCNYWWVAAPAGVVPVEEIPQTWGLIEVTANSHQYAKRAPELTPEPLDASFVASLLRNQAAVMAAAESRARRDTIAEFQEKWDRLEMLERELILAQCSEKRAVVAQRQISNVVMRFNDATGLRLNEWSVDSTAAVVRAVAAIRDPLQQMRELQLELDKLSHAVSEATAALEAAAKKDVAS